MNVFTISFSPFSLIRLNPKKALSLTKANYCSIATKLLIMISNHKLMMLKQTIVITDD